MNLRRIIKIKLEKLRKDTYPVALAINDRYIALSRDDLEIK